MTTSSPSRRILGFALLLALSAAPAFAQERLSLRGDVVAGRDALTVADLVENAPRDLADVALFRAPALGQTGTIQTRRIADAIEGLGLGIVETGGRLQITVTRAARQIGTAEIEGAIRKVLAEKHGIDPASTGINFDGPAPSMILPPDAKGSVAAFDLTLDRRSRRVAAIVAFGASDTERRASLRVTGGLVDLVEVAVISRAMERGETVKPGDLAVERRPRDVVPSDAALDGGPLAGRVARRALSAGSLVRAGDLAKPEIVGRGDMVTAVYEAPGMSLSMRVRASEAGALGDVISVVNAGSKKAVPATIVGPGKVSVRSGAAERVVVSQATAPQP